MRPLRQFRIPAMVVCVCTLLIGARSAGAQDGGAPSSTNLFAAAARASASPVALAFRAAIVQSQGGQTAAFDAAFARSFADRTVGSFMTSAILPTVLHTNPRYTRSTA